MSTTKMSCLVLNFGKVYGEDQAALDAYNKSGEVTDYNHAYFSAVVNITNGI